MALPPFRRVPYDASQATARMSDLVLRGGDIRAQGELQRGALWGGAVNQLGQIAGKTLGDLAAYREEAPRREAQQLALGKLRREESTEKNLAGLRQMAADGNLSSLDTAKLYEQAGYPEQAQRVRQGFLANVKTMGEINAMKLDMAGHAANRIQQKGFKVEEFQAEIQGLMKSGVFTAEEVQPYLTALEQAQASGANVEDGIKALTTEIMKQAPAYQPDLTPYTLAPGAMRMKGTQVVATNQKPEEPPKDVSLQQRYANLIAAGKMAEAEALLPALRAYRDATTRPPAAGGGGEKPLTTVQKNTVERWKQTQLRMAEDEYTEALKPRVATLYDSSVTGAIPGTPIPVTPEQKAEAYKRLTDRKRDIMTSYHEQMGDEPVFEPSAPATGGTLANLATPGATQSVAGPLDLPRPGFGTSPAPTVASGPQAPAPPPPQAPGAFIVTAPNGQMFTFATQAQADEFKRRAGLK